MESPKSQVSNFKSQEYSPWNLGLEKSATIYPVLCIAVSFLLFLFSSLSYSQTEEKTIAFFILKGNTRFLNGKPAEGVDLELRKDGKTITKITSGKNGKYYLQMEASTNNPKNEYLLYITQTGAIPKTLSINTEEEKRAGGNRKEKSSRGRSQMSC